MEDNKYGIYIVAIVAVVAIVALIFMVTGKSTISWRNTESGDSLGNAAWAYSDCYSYCTSYGPDTAERNLWCRRDCTTHSDSSLTSGRA